MARNLSECFDALDDALRLDPTENAQAKDIRAIIDEILTDAGWMAQSLFQGSYGRKTMYPPLKDVDLVVVLPKAWEHLRWDPDGSAKAMAAFRDAITRSGKLPGVAFDAHDAPAHALQLTVPGVTFTFDLVPAFETDDLDWLVIADRENRRWDKRSDVRALRNKVIARNVKCLGRWVRQVRENKHALRQEPRVKSLVCGLVMESLAYDVVIESVSPQKAAEAVFAQGARALTGPYRGLAQDDLTRKWSDLDRSMVVSYFSRMHEFAREALRYEATGDPVAASTTWQQVYGTAFPIIEVSFASRLAQVVRQGGGLTTAGRSTRITHGPGRHESRPGLAA